MQEILKENRLNDSRHNLQWKIDKLEYIKTMHVFALFNIAEYSIKRVSKVFIKLSDDSEIKI